MMVLFTNTMRAPQVMHCMLTFEVYRKVLVDTRNSRADRLHTYTVRSMNNLCLKRDHIMPWTCRTFQGSHVTNTYIVNLI